MNEKEILKSIREEKYTFTLFDEKDKRHKTFLNLQKHIIYIIKKNKLLKQFKWVVEAPYYDESCSSINFNSIDSTSCKEMNDLLDVLPYDNFNLTIFEKSKKYSSDVTLTVVNRVAYNIRFGCVTDALQFVIDMALNKEETAFFTVDFSRYLERSKEFEELLEKDLDQVRNNTLLVEEFIKARSY